VEAAMTDANVAYERDIALDLARRGLIVAPFAMGFGALLRGWGGVVGVGLGLAVVIVNYFVAGALQSWAATKGSPGLLGGTVLASLIWRFVVVCAALALLRNRSFLDFPTFGIAIVVSHLGLLAWEAKSVRLSLAYPGLTPRAGALGGKD
jgi:hypothetical protein